MPPSGQTHIVLKNCVGTGVREKKKVIIIIEYVYFGQIGCCGGWTDIYTQNGAEPGCVQ